MIRARACLALIVLLWAGGASAHKLSNSYLTITARQQDGTLHGRWDIAVRDLDHALGLDSEIDGAVTWGEVRTRQSEIARYALSRLALARVARADRGNCSTAVQSLLIDDHVDGKYAVLQFSIQCPPPVTRLSLHYSLLFDVDPNHRGLVAVRGTSGQSQVAVLSLAKPDLAVNLAGRRGWASLADFIVEGIWHIWKGLDHVLFLITLLLPAVLTHREGRWQARPSLRNCNWAVIKVVTAFTAAHSITLSLAATGHISMPSRLIESAIALTVLLTALNNLYPVVRERLWLVAFAFGLIHGLGFASVLGDLGLTPSTLLAALIGFNIGVEIGQLAIVLLVVPVVYLARQTTAYRRIAMPAGAVIIGVIALSWFVSRAFGIEFA